MSYKIAFAVLICLQFQARAAFAAGGSRPDDHGGNHDAQHGAAPQQHAPTPSFGGGGGMLPPPPPQQHDDTAGDVAAGVGAAAAGVELIGGLYDLYQQNQQIEQDEQQAQADADAISPCSLIYQGKFKSGDGTAINLASDAATITLVDAKSHVFYSATGTCIQADDSLNAVIRFTLTDDPRYTFSGKITESSDGSQFSMNLTESKSGKAIDQLSLVKKIQ